MSKVGYYIISNAQAGVLSALGIQYETLGGKNCVRDWQSCIDKVDELVWEDGEIDSNEETMLDIMEDQVSYLYWSVEGKTWS